MQCQGLPFALCHAARGAHCSGWEGWKEAVQLLFSHPVFIKKKKQKQGVRGKEKKFLSATKKFQYYHKLGEDCFSVWGERRGGEGCSPAWREQ